MQSLQDCQIAILGAGLIGASCAACFRGRATSGILCGLALATTLGCPMPSLDDALMAALAALLLGAISSPALAQSMEKKRDDKLKEAWLATKSPWIKSYDKAREEAKKASKYIFAYFTRSYSF